MKKTPAAILTAKVAANLERDERYSEAEVEVEVEWNIATCQSQNVFNQEYFDNRRDFFQKINKRLLDEAALASDTSANSSMATARK